jgi:leader peptidase (prepilin peptidase)/N-methyltransferase
MTFVFIIGAVFGSFLNVCIYRLPEKISLIFPSSSCPVCKKRIPFWANIPILGYLILKGKCYECSSRISIRYPLVELFAGILTVLSFLQFGFSVQFFIYTIFIYFLIVIAFIDIKTHLIYNKVLIIFFATGVITQIIIPFISWEQAVLGLIAGGSSMFFVALLGKWLFKKESLGMGDVKFAAVCGFFTGWLNILIALYLGFVLAFISITLHNRIKKRKISGYIPLGPFLAAGLILFLFWGKEISSFYLSMVL